MASSTIDTARFNDLTQLDSLSNVQLLAVRKLRRMAVMEGVTPYTIAAMASRSPNWQRIKDAKRYASLSPATREGKIADFREILFPLEPAVVAVWSAWCEQNGVDPFADEAADDSVRTTDPNGAVPNPALVKATESNFQDYRRNARGVRPRAEFAAQRLREILADGREHTAAEVCAAIPGVSTFTIQKVADEIGVKREVSWPSGRIGKLSLWSLPADAVPTGRLTDSPENPIHPGRPKKKGPKPGSPRTAPTSRREVVAQLREILSDGQEHRVAELEERVKTSNFTFWHAAKELDVVRTQYAPENGRRYVTWQLPSDQITDWDSLREPRLYLSTHPGMAEEVLAKGRKLERIARSYGVAGNTLVRWVEMMKTAHGTLYGSRNLPDREGEEGLELAEAIFQLCLPQGPNGLFSAYQRLTA